MVEERSAERRVVEMIGQRILARPASERQAAGVVVAQRQALRIAPVGETVHATAVDLVLLPKVRVNQVASLLCRRHVAADVEWAVGQVGREARVRGGRLLVSIHGLGQGY